VIQSPFEGSSTKRLLDTLPRTSRTGIDALRRSQVPCKRRCWANHWSESCSSESS